MKTLSVMLLSLLALSCSRPAPQPAATAEPERAPIAVTRWTNRTELFFEYPPLVVGEVSRFAIHVTRLDNFRAVRQGEVRVLLHYDGQPVQTFRVEGPSRPGIFGVDVKPGRAGSARLTIAFAGEGVTDEYDLGPVDIAASAVALPPAEEGGEDDAITFLKEQQWTLDFATALAAAKPLATSLRVPAEVEARSGGLAEVAVPFAGRLEVTSPLAIGARVEAGQVLAQLRLPVSNPQDLPGLELARREAAVALEYARKDLARAQRLVESGAVAAKRLEEATAAHATAAARLEAAEARLAQFEASRTAAAGGAGNTHFALRAPITGILSAVQAPHGANVTAGQPVFSIVDVNTVYIAAIVPEAEFPRMRQLAGAELEIPGLETPRRLAQLVNLGRIVDPASRTFPVVYQFDNRERHIALNQTVYVRLLFAATAAAPVVAESALVDDGGQPVVFVQLSGESFARRPVQLGQRAGGEVQILSGLTAGERVVTTGAHLIRLASLSTQVPAHGHVH